MFTQKQLENLKSQNSIFPEELIKSCDIGLSSVMVSKKLMKKKLFSNLKTKEDYLLWINLIKHKNYSMVLINTWLAGDLQKIHFQDQIFKN